MRRVARILLVLGISVLPVVLSAAGLGELRLLSYLGEPLRAEVDLIDPAKELSRSACFRLEIPLHSDLPHVAEAQFELSGRGEKKVLQIRSRTALNEPAQILSLRLLCGIEMRRDYSLLPELRLSPAEMKSADAGGRNVQATEEVMSQGGRGRGRGPGRVVPERRIQADGEQTLRQVVRSLRPYSPSAERWLYRKMASLNPEWRSGQVIPAGTEIIIPRLRDYSQTSDAAAPAPVLPPPVQPLESESGGQPPRLPDALAERVAAIEREFLVLTERMQALQEQTELLVRALTEAEAAAAAAEQELAEISRQTRISEPVPESPTDVPEDQSPPSLPVRNASGETDLESTASFGWLELLLAVFGVAVLATLLSYILVLRRLRKP